MEDFTKLALQKIPTFHGIKYSSQDLEDMLGVSNCGVNILFGCDPVIVEDSQKDRWNPQIPIDPISSGLYSLELTDLSNVLWNVVKHV